MFAAAMPWPMIAFIGYGVVIILINLGVALGERLHTLHHRRIHGVFMLASVAIALWSFLHGAAAAGLIATSLFVIFLCAVWHGADVDDEI